MELFNDSADDESPAIPPSLLLFLRTQKTSNFIPPSVAAVVVVVWLRDFGR